MKDEGSPAGGPSGVLSNYPIKSSGLSVGLVQALDWFLQEKISIDAVSGQFVEAVQENTDVSPAIMKLLAFCHQGGHLEDRDYRQLVAQVDNALTQEQPTQSYYQPQGAPRSSNVVELATRARPVPVAEAVQQRSLGEGSTLKDRYVIKERADDGGMGIVFKALDKRRQSAGSDSPFVAIKVLSEATRGMPEARQALEREAAKIQQLSHPNIVNVFDFDSDGEEFFMVMEWLDGEPLTQLLQRHRSAPLSRTVAVRMLRGIARGLAHAHQNGVAHADVKPANIYITRDRQVKVLDFGLSRAIGGKEAEDDNEVTGFTPAYASCEVLEGAPPTPQDDVYALGCIAYRLLTGNHPFGNLKATEAEAQDLVPTPIDGLPMGVWESIERALSFRREERTLNAILFLEELNPRQRQKAAGKSSAGGKFVRYGGIAVGLLALIAAGAFWFLSQESDPQVRPLEEEAQPAAATLLEQAKQALDAGRVTEPPLDNAYYYYSQVLSQNPADPVAKTGLELITQSTVSGFENAFAAGDFKEATRLAGVMETIAPEGAELSAALDQLNSRAATALENALAIEDEANAVEAQSWLSEAALILGEDSPSVAAARTELDGRFSTEAKIAALLAQMDSSIEQEQLLGELSASAFLAQAQAIDGLDPQVEAGKERLGNAMVFQATLAVAARDFAGAQALITEAKTLGVAIAGVDRAEQALVAAQRQAQQEVQARRDAEQAAARAREEAEAAAQREAELQAAAQAEIQEPAITEEPVAADATSEAPVEQQSTPEATTVAESQETPADTGLDESSTEAAQETPSTEVATANEADVSVADTETPLALALEAGALGNNTGGNNDEQPAAASLEPELELVPLSTLTFRRYVQPRFDPRVGRSDQGFVDVQFTVNTDGTVSNIRILDSSTMRERGVQRAESAVSRWQFEPITGPVDSGVRLRYQEEQ